MMNMSEKPTLIPPNTTLSYTILPGQEGSRIDTFLAKHHTAYSRTFFQQLIAEKHVTLNGKGVTKPSLTVDQHDTVVVHFPEKPLATTSKAIDPNLAINIIYEHEHFLVLSKPPHLSVHSPSPNNTEVTLVDWLLQHYGEIRLVGQEDRPGIVHRLDKDTSGLLLVARNRYAHAQLSTMFKEHRIKKTYIALVHGHPEKTGTIDFPVSRDPHHRTKMTHRLSAGRSAFTAYTVLEYFDKTALIELRPTTGRTHQLRVHCTALGHPIIGDHLYGTSSNLIDRQALHAQSLSFSFEGQSFSFSDELPKDFKELLIKLKTI